MLQRWDPKKSPPKHDFDRKVAEADVYLQLLIDQIKLIEDKQNAAENEEKQEKYSTILSQANAMLNSVKHTIVQLQIAKVVIISIYYLLFVVIIFIIYGLTNIFRTQQYLLMGYIEDHQILCMSHLNFLMVRIFIFISNCVLFYKCIYVYEELHS